MKAVILAAGNGIRLKPVTDSVPKCMVEVKGKPMLEHILERIVNAGAEEIELVVGYKRDIVEDHFGPDYKGIKLNYFVQDQPLGTAHAISLTKDYVSEKFIVANGDVITGTVNYRNLMQSDEFENVDGFILGRKVQDPWRYGVLKTQAREIKDIIEKPNPGEEPGNLVSTGIFRFKKEIFEFINKTKLSPRNEYEIVDSIKDYIKSGKKIEYKLCEGPCIDIGLMEDLERADSLPEETFPR